MRRFVTFEGVGGSGKTTQIRLLGERLKKDNINFILTREPGGTSISEEIRKILLDPKNTEMTPLTEILLFASSRAQHVEELIMPNLQKNLLVLCDRFVDSSVAYQSYGRGFDKDVVLAINNTATKSLEPDLTFMFLMDPQESLKRKPNNKDIDKFDDEELDFQYRLYDGYFQIAEDNSHRCHIIDATKKIEEINEEIYSLIKKL